MLGLSGALTARADLSASGERGVHASTAFAVLAAVGLGWALAAGDLTYRYVASWTSYATPLPYRIGALWIGPSGVLLCWAIAAGAWGSVAAPSVRRGSAMRAWTSALMALLLLAVLAMAALDVNPFLRLPFPPDDGRGLALELMRPVTLIAVPFGYLAMVMLVVPSVMTVMGALGASSWRDDTRRWATACWALIGTAMLLDWRRRYGDAAWADDWRWAPVHAGTAFAWAGAWLLMLAARRPWRANAAAVAGFVAFTLGMTGLALRRAMGWEGVHDFAASGAGRAAAWTALLVVAVLAADELIARRGASGRVAHAMRTAQVAVLVGAVALVSAGFGRSAEVAVREGGRVPVSDVFGTAWTLSLEGVSTVGREDVVANVIAVRAAVKGRGRGFVAPEVRSRYAGEGREPADQLQISGIAAGLAQDLRVDVREANTADAVLTVRFVPLATWLWIAGLIAALAALVAAMTSPASENAASPTAASDTVPAPPATEGA